MLIDAPIPSCSEHSTDCRNNPIRCTPPRCVTPPGEPALFLRLLGPVSLRVGEQDATLGGPKVAAFLTALVLHANQWVSLSRLTRAVWGDTAPVSATVNLRGYAGRIRGALRAGRPAVDDRLTSGRASYRLRVHPGEVDVDVFDRLTARARAALTDGEAAHAIRLFDQGLALWRGQPVENVLPVPAIEPFVTALDERRLSAAEDRLEALLNVGADAEAVTGARGLLSDNPDRERAWGLLMLALYRMGDLPGALNAYGQARNGLVKRLGIEPGSQLAQLHQMILNRDARLGPCGRPSWLFPRMAVPSGYRVPAGYALSGGYVVPAGYGGYVVSGGHAASGG